MQVVHRHGAVALLDVPVPQLHHQGLASHFRDRRQDKLEVLQGPGALLQVSGQTLEKHVRPSALWLGGESVGLRLTGAGFDAAPGPVTRM